MRRIVCLVVAAAALGLCLPARSAQGDRSVLTLEEIVKLTRAGVSEEIIVARVKKAGRAFDLTTDEILELRRSGVSDAVVKVLIDPTQPYSPPPAPPPPPATPVPAAAPEPKKTKPANPLLALVPPEPGIYFRQKPDGPDFARLELKPLTAIKSGGGLAKVLTGGLKKTTVTGFVVGAASKLSIAAPAPGFYVRLPEKAAIEDLILLVLTVKDGRRQIDLGPDAAKPVFPPPAVKQYESERIDEGLFHLRTAPLDPGEYFFLLMGSADEKKGVLGKGYEFGLAPQALK